MIAFGTRSKKIQSGRLNDVDCSFCFANTTMTYSVFAKYFHIYWIPFFPLKKKATVECQNCFSTFEQKELSKSAKAKLDSVRNNNSERLPFWMFSGIIVLSILIPLAFFQSSRADSKKKDYKNNPKVGDVYFLNSVPSKYTTMKIAVVEKDSVHFILNDTTVTKFTKVFGINKDHYYSTKRKSYSKSQLTQLLENDSIYSIER